MQRLSNAVGLLFLGVVVLAFNLLLIYWAFQWWTGLAGWVRSIFPAPSAQTSQVTTDELEVCAAKFGSVNGAQLSIEDQKARGDCIQKSAKVMELAFRDAELYHQLEAGTLKELDDWVAAGGKVEDINKSLLPACAKLVSLYATAEERREFPRALREEWDFRVDVCVKGTVHRRHPQPEFENKQITDQLCSPDNNKLWSVVCQRAGVR